MVIYEVNLEIDPSIAEAYLRWLKPHIAELLTLDGFESARLFQVESNSGTVDYCVHYQLRDRAVFDWYLETHASTMRQDAINRFGDRFRSSRRLLHAVDA